MKHLILLSYMLLIIFSYPVMRNPKLASYLKSNPAPSRTIPQIIDPSLPTEFDGRKEWPGCIHPVLDQGDCGSCWAFAASEVLSDRFCIHSNGSINVVLSPQNLLSCEELNWGCAMGSLPMWAWRYLQNYGITTMGCVPYQSYGGDVPSCQNSDAECEDAEKWKLYAAANYTQCGSLLNPSRHVEEIMNAVMQGPVDSTFNVWGDFFEYTSGVYTHQGGDYEGLHSVKIIGFGVENGVDYWLVQNSWGSGWGDHGFFKIARGTDECFFESLVYTGFPKLK